MSDDDQQHNRAAAAHEARTAAAVSNTAAAASHQTVSTVRRPPAKKAPAAAATASKKKRRNEDDAESDEQVDDDDDPFAFPKAASQQQTQQLESPGKPNASRVSKWTYAQDAALCSSVQAYVTAHKGALPSTGAKDGGWKVIGASVAKVKPGVKETACKNRWNKIRNELKVRACAQASKHS